MLTGFFLKESSRFVRFGMSERPQICPSLANLGEFAHTRCLGAFMLYHTLGIVISNVLNLLGFRALWGTIERGFITPLKRLHPSFSFEPYSSDSEAIYLV